MSFQVIITGKLTRPPQNKVSKNGNAYGWMLMSVPTEQERLSATVVIFDHDVIRIADKLAEGDEVAVTGTATINQWERDDGTSAISLNVIGSQIMTMYQHRKKKKQFNQDEQTPSETQSDDFGDSVDAIKF